MNSKTAEKLNSLLELLSVRIEKAVDQSPDTSYLGEYNISPRPGWYCDRQADTLCDNSGRVLAAGLGCNYGRHEMPFIVDFQHDGNPANWAHVSTRGVVEAYLKARGVFQKYGITKPALNRAGLIRACDIAYCCQDSLRLERLNAGDWCYLGIIAKAEYASESGTVQTLHSGGLWGVESDSGPEYLASVAADELASLRTELESVGFGARAIDFAFKTVETKNV